MSLEKNRKKVFKYILQFRIYWKYKKGKYLLVKFLIIKKIKKKANSTNI